MASGRAQVRARLAVPRCYVGEARFEKGLAAFAHRDGIEVVHRSFELDPNRTPRETTPVIDMIAKKYGRTREEAQAMEEHVASTAHAEGLEHRTEGREHGNTFDIHRLLHLAKARGLQDELLTRAYRLNFAEERSIFDPDVPAAAADSAVH
ncbi:DsbA family protein [Streptomyces sp. NPDC048389]|uniref:DsbA family protein n=1 Tax=Streptomyces sp. NPDC048389 TaxID=3154622 RepID=UPI0034570E32